jgi:hypothetical protein
MAVSSLGLLDELPNLPIPCVTSRRWNLTIAFLVLYHRLVSGRIVSPAKMSARKPSSTSFVGGLWSAKLKHSRAASGYLLLN